LSGLPSGIFIIPWGKLNQSIESYEEALEIEPEWGVAYYKIGVTYFRAGKLIKSLEAFNKVLELRNQSHAMASYFVGLINFFLGRDEVSDSAFTQFHEIAPESMIANYFLAEIKIKKNHFNEAIALLEELLEENAEPFRSLVYARTILLRPPPQHRRHQGVP
jgi:tetratricopeptide (TPR) repeat protein